MSRIGTSQGTTRPALLPTSRLGGWALGSFGLMAVAGFFLIAMGMSGQSGGETLFDNLLLGIPGIVAALAAAASAATGITAIARAHERALAPLVATGVSGFVFLFVALTLLFGE